MSLLDFIARKKCESGLKATFVVCEAGSCKESNAGQLLQDQLQTLLGKDSRIKLFQGNVGFRYGFPVSGGTTKSENKGGR